jgi:hypothetical protein
MDISAGSDDGMSAIRADVCDNARSDVMRAIRISWRIVVVVVVTVGGGGGGVRGGGGERRCSG